MAHITISPADLTRATRLVKAYRIPWTPIMARTALATMRWIDQNFRREGALALSGGWEELSPITLMFRRADWRRSGKPAGYSGRPSPASGAGSGSMVPGGNLGPGSYKILQDTGEMKGSANFRVLPLSARVGFSSIKAATHQYGRYQFWPLLGKTVKIPARPILPNAQQAQRIFMREVIAEVRREVQRAGYKSGLKPGKKPRPA